ncbi:MAG: hypothetical protein ACI841_003903 [Planctomycetota bacterium]|jgi:hypothetical protein
MHGALFLVRAKPVIRKTLRHLDLDLDPPPVAPARPLKAFDFEG